MGRSRRRIDVGASEGMGTGVAAIARDMARMVALESPYAKGVDSGLVESEIGEFPSHAAIETVEGTRHSIAVDADEVQQVRDRALPVLDSALSVLDRVNDSMLGELDSSLASPAAAVCGSCSFRPACAPFFEAYDETWPTAHPLLFEVVTVDSSPHGYRLQATVRRRRWRE
ncbi:hypothetical protein [Mycobacterium aquaticum]|uniref:hypothetical protein n=1 Tax=Mycobacterium aquaticum TaxID=1927124 RepID=UPI001153E63B|nr:hypothetical protein [Mycobacterium aquaticum]